MIKFLIGYGIFSALSLWWMFYIAKHTPITEDDTNELYDIDFNLEMEKDDWKYLL